jgi:hypothetical protein
VPSRNFAGLVMMATEVMWVRFELWNLHGAVNSAEAADAWRQEQQKYRTAAVAVKL